MKRREPCFSAEIRDGGRQSECWKGRRGRASGAMSQLEGLRCAVGGSGWGFNGPRPEELYLTPEWRVSALTAAAYIFFGIMKRQISRRVMSCLHTIRESRPRNYVLCVDGDWRCHLAAVGESLPTLLSESDYSVCWITPLRICE